MSESRDDRISQLMHELADASPRPPEWEELSPTLQLGRREEPDRRGVWVLAAAAVVAVVGIVGAIAAWAGREEVRTSDAPAVPASSSVLLDPPATSAPSASVPASGSPGSRPDTVPEAPATSAVVPDTAAPPSTASSTTAEPADSGPALVQAYLGDLAGGRYADAASRLGDPRDWRSRSDLAALTLATDAEDLAGALEAWCAAGAVCAAPASVTPVTDPAGGAVVVAEYRLEADAVFGTYTVTDDGRTLRGLPPLASSAALDVLAAASDAEVIVARLPDDVVVTWDDGTTTELGPAGDAWVRAEGQFVLWEEPVTDENGVPAPHTQAMRLDGQVVCDVDGHMHRLREVDGRLVASVERVDELPVPTGQDQPIPNYAVDCETGERTAIDPISWTREGGSRGVTRVADRTFSYEGDAEGNADMANESGVSIDGDDYAGYHTFSPDGSRVVYADFTDAPGPHYTDRIRARDTTSGELLWTGELVGMFGSLQHTGDRVLVAHPAPAGDPMSPWESTSWVDVYDADTGELVMTVATALQLDHLH